MAYPVADSYSGKINSPIIGGKFRRAYVIGASLVQGNLASAVAVSSNAAAHQVTVANVSQANFASSVYLLTPSVPAGELQQLTVASHLRRLSLPQGAANVGYDPAPMVASEAITPSAVSAVPFRGYSVTVKGPYNTLMVDGSGHGAGYAGNEVDKMLMPMGAGTQIVTTINHQPVVSPSGGFSNWGSGGGAYIHKQSYAPAGLVGYDDQTEAANWQPYTRHNYTNASWNPFWGYTFFSSHAKQVSYPDGAYVITGGVLQSSDANPTDTTSSGIGGIVSFDESTGKYKTQISFESLGSMWRTCVGFSDWNNWREELLVCVAYTWEYLQILAWRSVGGFVKIADLEVSPTDPVLTNCALTDIGAAPGNNGVLFRHMELGKYLLLVQASLGGRAGTQVLIFSEDFGLRQNRIVNLTSSLPGSGAGQPFNGVSTTVDPLSFCIDKNSRRIFWLIYPGAGSPIRFYKSTFDDPMVWTQITYSPSITINSNEYLSLDRQPFHFMNGYLFIHDDSSDDPAGQAGNKGSFNFKRIKVDSGEDLPVMSFQRFDYLDQNFRFTGYPVLGAYGKHVNWAKRKTTGEHIMCAGDHGSAYNAGMAKLVFDGTSRGYTITEELGEVQALSAALGKYRPMGPDDGGWFYSSNANPNPAFRDKFIFARGGDGVAWNSCNELKTAYSAYATDYNQWMNSGGYADAGAIAKMQEDGWTDERVLVYDPNGKYFSLLGAQGWTWDAGGAPNGHPITTLGSSSARNAAFDEATNSLFRITMHSGGLWLIKYDLTNQTIKGWPIGNWVDTDGLVGPAGRTWFFGEGLPPTQGDVTANGFGYYNTVSSRWSSSIPGHWEHKAIWINPVDGKLYGVSPDTGYLWCFETRGTETASSSDGRRIPFYPVGNRIPLIGVYPPLATQKFPSVVYTTPGSGNNGSVTMNSFLVPFKGGLLWWSNSHFAGGTFGHPIHAFWRRLDYTGDWTVVSFPQEFAAQAYSIDSSTIDNAEVSFLGGGGALEEYPTRSSFLWKMT